MALTDNLISYWKLDEASGTALDAHGANDLTDNNTVGTGTGKINGARDFEAGSLEFFSHTSNADFVVGDIDFTFSAWVFLESEPTIMSIVSRWPSSGKSYDLIAYSDRFQFFVSSDGSAQSSVAANNFGSITTGAWYFVVCWHDSVNNQIGISVNDVSDTAAYTTGVNAGTAPFRLGKDEVNASYWDGLIDEVGYWKRVLTSQERTDLYNSGNGLSYDDFGGAGDSVIEVNLPLLGVG